MSKQPVAVNYVEHTVYDGFDTTEQVEDWIVAQEKPGDWFVGELTMKE